MCENKIEFELWLMRTSLVCNVCVWFVMLCVVYTLRTHHHIYGFPVHSLWQGGDRAHRSITWQSVDSVRVYYEFIWPETSGIVFGSLSWKWKVISKTKTAQTQNHITIKSTSIRTLLYTSSVYFEDFPLKIIIYQSDIQNGNWDVTAFKNTKSFV